MDRLKYRAHARRKKEAAKGRSTRGRPRRSMNGGNIMRAEVQRFKDAEKSLQDGEGSSATNKRMSIPRRRNTAGCQRENMPKGEIGMSERVKARANANLLDIVTRAREEPSLPPPSNTVSPHRYFLPKKGTSHCPKRDKKSKKLSDDFSSQDTSSSSDVPVNPPGKKTVAAADQPGTSSQSTPAPENPTTAESSESTALKKPADKADSKETKFTADKTFMFEYLMTAVNEAMEEHANRLVGANGMSADIVSRIHRKYGQSGRLKEEGAQNHGRREGPRSTEVIRSIDKRKVCQRPTDVLATPSCLDFLRASLMDSPTKSDENEKTNVDDEWATLGKPSHSPTTIMSPRGLLKHHAKLQTRKAVPRGPQHHASEYKNLMAFPLVQDPGHCHDRVLLRDKPQCAMSVEPNEHDLQRLKKQRTPSPLPTVPQCPKTVVVDPLHYLERYVGKTQGQGNSSTQVAAAARGGYVNVGEDSCTSQTLPHTVKHKLIRPHQNLGQGSLVDTEPYGLVRSGTGHATNTSHEHSHSWQSWERKMHPAYGEGHGLEGNAHMVPTAQQDLHSIPQGHHHHHHKGTHQSTNTWVQFPASNAAQQPRPLLNLTDDIFPCYQYLPSNSSLQPPSPPQIQPTMPPPPQPPRPSRRQSPVNTENPHTRGKVRNIFTLTPIARQSSLPLVQSEERTAAAATHHQPHGASHRTRRNTRYAKAIWSAEDASKFSQLDQVAPSHAQQKGSVRGADSVSGWSRECVGGMYCGGFGCGCCVPLHVVPQPTHPTVHTKHWQR